MKTYAYSVTVEGQGNQHIINTNDVSYAIHEFLRAHACGCEVVVCNGTTGEVLCHNGDEPYTTDEMGLMIAGYLSIFGLPEGVEMSDEDEVEDVDPAVALLSALFGVPADEVVALHNGVGLPGRDLDVSPCLLPIPKGLPS